MAHCRSFPGFDWTQEECGSGNARVPSALNSYRVAKNLKLDKNTEQKIEALLVPAAAREFGWASAAVVQAK